MSSLLISPQFRDALRDLILRGRFWDDPAVNIVNAVAGLNGLAAAQQPTAEEKPKRRRGRPHHGLAAVPPAAPEAPESHA